MFSIWRIRNFFLDPDPELFVPGPDPTKRKEQIQNLYFPTFIAVIVVNSSVDCSNFEQAEFHILKAFKLKLLFIFK